MKRKDLIGFGDNYLTQDEFYSIQLYLKDTYCKSVAVPLGLPFLKSIFDDAENLMKQGIYYSSLIPGLLFIGMSLSSFP
jgi:hypothetical protein